MTTTQNFLDLREWLEISNGGNAEKKEDDLDEDMSHPLPNQ